MSRARHHRRPTASVRSTPRCARRSVSRACASSTRHTSASRSIPDSRAWPSASNRNCLSRTSATDAFADVVFVVRDYTTGQVVQSGSDRLALPREPAPGSAAGQGVWRTRFELAAGTYLMRCIVREPGGLIGQRRPAVYGASAPGPDASTSDLILGIPGEQLPVRTMAYTNELMSGAVRAYGRSEAQLGGLSATLDLVSLADAPGAELEHPVRSISGGIGPPTVNAQGVVRDVSFSVPLSDLPPGDYVAHVLVRAAGEAIGDLRRQVTVVDGSRPAAASATPASNARTATSQRPRDILRGNIVKQMVEHAAKSDVAPVRQAAEEAAGGRWARSLVILEPLRPPIRTPGGCGRWRAWTARTTRGRRSNSNACWTPSRPTQVSRSSSVGRESEPAVRSRRPRRSGARPTSIRRSCRLTSRSPRRT